MLVAIAAVLQSYLVELQPYECGELHGPINRASSFCIQVAPLALVCTLPVCLSLYVGDFDRLRKFVEADASCVSSADDQGYLPLQWAALNNRVAECTYLLSNGAEVNAQDATGEQCTCIICTWFMYDCDCDGMQRQPRCWLKAYNGN